MADTAVEASVTPAVPPAPEPSIAEEWEAFQAEPGEDTEAPAPETESPAAEPPPTPVAPEKIKVTSLDDVILEDPRLPKTLFGQPGTALYDDRTRAHQEAYAAGERANRALESKAVYEKALEIAGRKMRGEEPAPAPKTEPTVAEQIAARIEPIAALGDPRTAHAATVEIAEQRMTPKVDAVAERVSAIERQRAAEVEQANQQKAVKAYLAAKPADVAMEVWRHPQLTQHIVAAVEINNQSVVDGRGDPSNLLAWDDPDTYRQVAQRLVIPRIAAPAPQAQPAPSPAPAPPVGNARSAPVAGAKPKARVSGRMQNDMNVVAKAFGFENADAILDELMDDPNERRHFE